MKSRHKTLKQRNETEAPFFSFPVLLSSSMNEVRKYARKRNLDTLPAFLDSVIAVTEEEKGEFPNARNILLRCLLFPMYPMLGKKNVDLICRVLATLP
jgi:dTDP-4-amino-4,6-dideoxygalactose transaminase